MSGQHNFEYRLSLSCITWTIPRIARLRPVYSRSMKIWIRLRRGHLPSPPSGPNFYTSNPQPVNGSVNLSQEYSTKHYNNSVEIKSIV